MNPLFIPLKRQWFEAFARGEKTDEWRLYGPRWNEGNCRVGRVVTLSLGYGARHVLRGRVVGFSCRRAVGPAATLYGRDAVCAVISIQLDGE